MQHIHTKILKPNKLRPKAYRGFTMIELMVVITIVGLLASISVFSFVGYIAGSRDSRRIVDIQSIAMNTDLYYKKNQYVYPIPSNSVHIVYSSGASVMTGAYLGSMTEDKLTDMSQLPVDPKTKTYYTYATTTNYKKYELATRLEKADSWQKVFSDGILTDPSIFGNNVYIVGNYRLDSANGYNLRGMIVFTGSAVDGLTLPPSTTTNVGTWNTTNLSIDYTGSGIVMQKQQTSY